MYLPLLLLGYGLSMRAVPVARAQEGPVPPQAALHAVPEEAPRVSDDFLEWTPSAWHELSAQAANRSSVVLDRDMLSAAAELLPGTDDATRRAVQKLDGMSLHVLRFHDDASANEDLVEALRQVYRHHGWRHLVSASGAKAPIKAQSTDLWLATDGVKVKGAVVLVESGHSLVLVSVKGELSPVDLLHLRGHFGIPKFAGEHFEAGTEQ